MPISLPSGVSFSSPARAVAALFLVLSDRDELILSAISFLLRRSPQAMFVKYQFIKAEFLNKLVQIISQVSGEFAESRWRAYPSGNIFFCSIISASFSQTLMASNCLFPRELANHQPSGSLKNSSSQVLRIPKCWYRFKPFTVPPSLLTPRDFAAKQPLSVKIKHLLQWIHFASSMAT